jgi:hypothetical protein
MRSQSASLAPSRHANDAQKFIETVLGQDASA